MTVRAGGDAPPARTRKTSRSVNYELLARRRDAGEAGGEALSWHRCSCFLLCYPSGGGGTIRRHRHNPARVQRKERCVVGLRRRAGVDGVCHSRHCTHTPRPFENVREVVPHGRRRAKEERRVARVEALDRRKHRTSASVGANLSEEYFRSRQDRYVVVRDHKVADWYDQAVRAAAAAPDAGERARALRELCTGPAPTPAPRRRRFHRSRRRPAATLFPTAQVRDLLDLDARALSAVLDASPRCGLSTAYANPPPAVVEALGRTAATVVVPSPDTHGFAGATGVKAFLPLAHARFAWDLATKLKGSGDVRAWAAPRETYHAKGCWAFSAGDERRVGATVVGSSNWNVRSHRRDVELGAALVVRDGALRRRLGDQWRRLRSRARDPVAAPPAWTALLRGVLRPFA